MGKLMPVQNMIFTLRGQRIMLDSDLAKLYDVETKRINEAVKRNLSRFPDDFMFQLTEKEWAILRSQFVTSKGENLKSQFATSSWGGSRRLPYAFTEHGILMLSSVLRSDIAIDVNIKIMRIFVKMRQYAISPDTNGQIVELRKLLLLYIEKNDKRVNGIIKALDSLIAAPPLSKTIGFKAN